jgi:hypothetical protein
LTGLLVPADNIFWTANENEGDWDEKIKKEQVSQQYSPGSHILITDYANIGAAEIRAWCFSKNIGYYQGTENYNKLAYNSAFPWQEDSADGTAAMNYAVSKNGKKWETLRMYTFLGYGDKGYLRAARLATDSTIHFRLKISLLHTVFYGLTLYLVEVGGKFI